MLPSIIAIAVSCAIGAGSAWVWQSNAYERRISNLRAEYAEVQRQAIEAANGLLLEEQDRAKALTAKVASLDAKATEEKERAKAENDALRRDVADGVRRLRINATCAPAAGGAPGGPAAASLGDAPAARLTQDAERAYFSLRDEITAITSQVNTLQSYIRATLPPNE